jgi:predicted lipoprotein with Yx(FWY)xxD motif
LAKKDEGRVMFLAKAWLRTGVSTLALACIVAATPYSPAIAADGHPAAVSLQQRGHGWVMTDASGMSLYTFEQDQEPGKSTCNGACEQLWPPLAARAEDVSAGDWSVIARNDGSKQWAFRGKPLYAYSRDSDPGVTYGDDLNGQWTVAIKPIALPAGVTISKTVIGYVLADAASMTLYSSDADKNGQSNCDIACARTWQPLIAPWAASTLGDWSTIARQDGTKQWAYKGKPLYRYAEDVVAGETIGHDVGKSWHALVLEPPLPLPSWVTVQSSDATLILATADGKTLYTRTERRRRATTPPPAPVAKAVSVSVGLTNAGESHPTAEGAAPPAAAAAPEPVGVVGLPPPAPEQECGVECPGSDWRPVLATATDKPVGNWSLVARADGAMQWAHKGLVLYTNVRDILPGDFNGLRFGGDRSWKCITYSGKPMQGTGPG